jgi:AAA domain
LAALRIDLVGTTADFRRPGPRHPLPLNHLPGENRGTAGRIGEVGLDLELAERTVIADTVGETVCIFLAGLYRTERVIAERILRLANGKLPWPYIDSEKALPWIEQKTGLSLAESQVAAIRLALLSKVLVITGGPGVGKTTIVNSILRILAASLTSPIRALLRI